MTVPDEKALEFTPILESPEAEQVSCCCTDFLIVD